MDKRLNFKVLLGAVLLALLLGAVNNLVNEDSVAWVGSQEILPKPEDWPTLTVAQGVQGAFKVAWKGLWKDHAVIFACLILAGILVYTLKRQDDVPASPVIRSLLRVGIGFMFLAAAAEKFGDPKDFALAVTQYQMLPSALVNPFALVMAAIEIVAGLGLIFTPWEREFSLLVGVLFVMFIVALAQALGRGLGIACGCFDIKGAADAGETWFSLIRDVVLLVPVGWMVWKGSRRYLWQA